MWLVDERTKQSNCFNQRGGVFVRTNRRCIVLMAAVLICFATCGCKMGCATIHPSKEHSRLLKITAERDESCGFTTITPEQLGGIFPEDIVYHNLSNVCIEITGRNYPLEEAIRDGRITVEEIFAYARIDARNGLCVEQPLTENGLTRFLYRYPECDVCLTYDIYETSDGKEHLIQDLGIYKDGINMHVGYNDDETGEPIDLENWGLQFEVVEATPTGVSLRYTQSGGQQIGELQIDYYGLYHIEDGYKDIEKIDGSPYGSARLDPGIIIEENSESRLAFDWGGSYGTMPPGKYQIYLGISDVFDESQVHLLMRDFQTSMTYFFGVYPVIREQ